MRPPTRICLTWPLMRPAARHVPTTTSTLHLRPPRHRSRPPCSSRACCPIRWRTSRPRPAPPRRDVRVRGRRVARLTTAPRPPATHRTARRTRRARLSTRRTRKPQLRVRHASQPGLRVRRRASKEGSPLPSASRTSRPRPSRLPQHPRPRPQLLRLCRRPLRGQLPMQCPPLLPRPRW